MSRKDLDFFYVNDLDAQNTAAAMEDRLGIAVQPLGDTRKPNPYEIHDETLNIDPDTPFIVFNGSGYFHNTTLAIFKDAVRKRRAAAKPEISYIHIDGHDDIAPPTPGNHEAYKSFVLGIDKVNDGGVYILQEGLTGEKDSGFIQPAGPETWGDITHTFRDAHSYLSIDLDVLDIDALNQGEGIHHLFPQSPIGFDMSRLEANIDIIGSQSNIIGADLVGFSTKGATPQIIEQSYDNIARTTERIIKYF